jgi:hypothetical protein
MGKKIRMGRCFGFSFLPSLGKEGKEYINGTVFPDFFFTLLFKEGRF